MKRTESLIHVAVVLMEDPAAHHWGYDVSKKAKIRSGVLYPILHRMLDEEWLTDGWEETPADGRKRPPRRYYELTDKGRAQLGALLAAAPRSAPARVRRHVEFA